MGQKVNPISLRLKISNTWLSSWYSDTKEYKKKLHQDLRIRDIFNQYNSSARINKIIIERVPKKVIINIHTSRVGVIIGKKGSDIEYLKKTIEKISPSNLVIINVIKVNKFEIEPLLVARSIAEQLKKRISFRRAIKRSISSAIKMGAKGIRINTKGRLGGSEIARMEWYKEGRIPLHTLRANINYAKATANTMYGAIGIKVWIYKGENMSKDINYHELSSKKN
jgi:small subunit ribosomal protein S3